MREDFADIARAHWTKERETKVTGGRRWPLLPSEAPWLLRALGLLNADASMSAANVRKFSQINHMVSLLEPHLADLAARHKILRILDAGCGTSFLTLLLAWLLKEKQGKPCQILGVDKNPKVVATSEARATELGLTDVLRFETAEIAVDYGATCFARVFPAAAAEEKAPQPPGAASRPHLLVALHACDTASDLALALGIRARADVMAVAPCCHGELARKWKELVDLSHPFAPIFRSPNLRRETAAQITDAMRLLLIRSKGYEVTATEFVPSEHTPKNRLLVCVRRGQFLKEADDQLQDLKASLGDQTIHLEDLLAHGA